MQRIIALAATLLFSFSAAAQATHFVDPAGGAGIHTDIQSAISAAVHGDVIDVAPGTYAAFTCSKGVTIIGSGVVRIAADVTLQNLPAGRQIALADMQLVGMEVLACDGVVVLNQIEMGSGPGLAATTMLSRLHVVGSRDVRFGHLVFTTYGPPNANLRVWLGRYAFVQPSAGAPIERLCQWLRGAAPGNMPASGQKSVNQPIPGWLPRGFTFWVQAELVSNTGQLFRTNSLSVVIR